MLQRLVASALFVVPAACFLLTAGRSSSADWRYGLDKGGAGLADIAVNGKPVPLVSGVPCGVHVEEIVSRADKAVSTGNGGRFSITAISRRSGDAVIVTAEISDTKGGDSAADVFYQIPVDVDGWTWHGSIVASASANSDQSQTEAPISVLTNTKTGAGLAVAITPETPCMFASGCSKKRGLYMKAKIGFSSLTNPASKARISFAIYPVDAEWGMRSALKTYYELFPKSFEGFSKMQGLWIFHGKAATAPNPTQFGFHSLGELGECRHLGKVAVDILTPEEIAREKKCGIEIYPYVIPGQREVGFLDKLKGEGKTMGMPEQDQTRDVLEVHYSTAEALDVLSRMTDRNFTISQRIQPVPDYIATIESSYLIGADGDIVTRPRVTDWSDRSLTFPMNPNPSLPTGGAKFNAGTEILNECHKWLEGPWDGIYVDSLYRWGEYINYRREHFPYAKYGLTYGPDGRPCLDNSLEHLAFLDELLKLVRSKGAKLSANGVRQKCFFLAQRLDIAGSEFGTNADIEGIAFRREMTYQKPYMSMNHSMQSRESDRRYIGRCFLFGVYGDSDMPYFGTPDYAKLKDLYDTYLPIQREMCPLGWEPMTYARALSEGVLTERFGGGAKLFFTLYRDSGEARAVDLEVNCAALKLTSDKITVTDPVSGRELETTREKAGELTIRGIRLNSDGFGVVKLEGA